ncbi:MAG: sulfotransferase [Thermodesulfobacteriota bacterium]
MALTADRLLDGARRATGLDDFGDPSFRDGLEVLLEAIEREAALNDVGRMAHEAQLGGYLAERLRIEDWYRRHPEIEAQRIDGPVFITGLPRTGTTALSHLLACDPDTRSLQMWESHAPTPPPERATYASDPRIAEADARNAAFRDDPDFRRMYDATATSPTENIDLLGQHFRTQHFEGMAHVPSYIRWWLACDMVPAYRHHERVLKLLQWRCPPTRWHLKSPPDLCCLDAFVAVYPGARIVWTHRDPAKVLASVCKLIFLVRRMQTDRVDLHELGREQLALWSEGVRRALAFRERFGDERFADVFMDDLVARPIDTVAALYERVGLPFTDAAERRMRAWSSEHPQHRLGAVPYTLEEFGLRVEDVRAAFADYTRHFALRLEA